MSYRNAILNGSVVKSLVKFTVPVFFALVLQVMYSTVDMYIVSNYSTVEDVSGVSTGAQLMNIIIALCSGLASGATVLIGQYIGQGAKEKVGTVIGNSLVLFTVFSLVISFFIIVFNNELVVLLNTPTQAVQTTSEYIFYSSIGIPMIFLYNIISSFFRGIGNSKIALLTIGIACVVNIILDMFFVVFLNMGAGGAAIATVISQTISVVISLTVMLKMPMLTITAKSFCIKLHYIKNILKLGIPIACQGFLVSISFLAIVVIVNQFGLVYSAAVGVVGRIVGFIMLVPISFGQSVSVFVSQNYGAGQHARAKKGLAVSIAIAFSVSLVMAYIAFFHGDILVSIFNSDTEIVVPATEYLKSYAIDTLLVPILFCITGYLTGYGKTLFTMSQSMIGAIGIRLILMYLFSLVTPTSLFLIGLGTPIASIVQIAICFIYFGLNFSDKKVKLLSEKKA